MTNIQIKIIDDLLVTVLFHNLDDIALSFSLFVNGLTLS